MEAVWKKLISPETLTSLILVAAAVLVWFLLRKLLDRLRGRPDTWEMGGKKDTVLRIVSMVSKTLLVLFTVVTVLQINGINISALVASLGLVSAVVGLALQDLLKDYIMSFNILSEKFFSVGDPVRYNGREGIVIGFTARTTKIRDLDDLSVTTVSNRNISQITVLSNMMDLDLPLAYEEDPARIHAVLADLCEDVRHSPGVESCEYKGTSASPIPR